MRIGCAAWLQMKKPIKKGVKKAEQTYECKVWRYDENKECLYLALQEAALSNLSLDAIYECKIEEGAEGLLCTGHIRERYHSEGQQMVKFEIENGFYKIYLN